MANNKKVRPTGGEQVTLARYTVDEIMNLHTSFSPGDTSCKFKGPDGNEYKARVYNSRIRTFFKRRSCSRCGLDATHFNLERMTDAPEGVAHLNMYGTRDDGEVVLFTKDHIIPVVDNGANDDLNLQTMCTICNMAKGHNPENTYKVRVVLDGKVYGKTFGSNSGYAVNVAKSILFEDHLPYDVKWDLHFWDTISNMWLKVIGGNDIIVEVEGAKV